MPVYIFQHPNTQEVKEIVQGMNEPHVYVDKKGVKWDRIFTKPQAALDTKINAHSVEDFKNKTRNKNYTLGQMWDTSAELSEKRGGASGQDEIRQKAEDAYEKKTGKIHPQSKKRQQKEFLI